jgi:hypothetical protein
LSVAYARAVPTAETFAMFTVAAIGVLIILGRR